MQHSQGKRCSACGYDLTGLREARCPECGREFHPAAAWSHVSGTRSGLGPFLLAVPAILALFSPGLVLYWAPAAVAPWLAAAAVCGAGALMGVHHWAGRLRRYPLPTVTNYWALHVARMIAAVGLVVAAVALGCVLEFAALFLLFMLLH
jgi:hypothetical protein